MDKNITAGNLTVSSAPHIVTSLDTAKTMQLVLIALIPALCASTYFFGPRVLLLTAVCIVGCVLCEWAYEKIMKKPVTIQDFSACVTGALLAFNLPANFPIWMALIGCVASIVVVKMMYGGLGRNFANPAIVGRIVLLLSFTSQMTSWPVARGMGVDAKTAATPLGLMSDGGQIPPLKNMFLGMRGGAMGEVCAIALIIGGLFLIWKKIISPIIPASMLGTMFVISLIYYAVKGGYQDYNALYMAVYQVLAGGAVLGAFFCATDYVTSPIMPTARLIYGCGIGAVTMIIRLMCSYPEGVSFAILFMNIMTPLIEKTVTKRYYQSLYGGGKNEK